LPGTVGRGASGPKPAASIARRRSPCSNRSGCPIRPGDLKRVELAIALAHDPVLLLMDEPTAGMAPAERIELMALARSIVRAQGLAALFTEHDMDVVFEHADRIMVMNRGVLIADGSPEEVRADRLVREIYLGAGGHGPVAAELPAARHA
jgi:branched-chain amino acid transport system ATP-binding protein